MIDEDQWSVLLRGGAVSQPDSLKKQLPNPDEMRLTELNWNMVYFLDLTIKAFEGLMSDFVENLSQWVEWSESENPYQTKMPGVWSEKLN